jgi:hypothetical protein
MSKYWSEQDEADYKFISVPKVFVTGYKDVSLQAKWVYSILLDRLMMSRRNIERFSDEEGLFLYFKQDEMAGLLGVTTRAVRKTLSELKDKGLIETKVSGLGKPSRIYLTKLSECSREEEKFRSDRKKSSAQTGKKVPIREEEKFRSERKKSSAPIVNNTYMNYTEGESVNAPAKFVPPTLEEVQAYIAEKGYTFSAEQFMASNEQKGWCIGRSQTPMQNWKAACLVWEKNQQQFARDRPPQKTPPQDLDRKWGILNYDEYMKGEYNGRESKGTDWGFNENFPPSGFNGY